MSHLLARYMPHFYQFLRPFMVQNVPQTIDSLLSYTMRALQASNSIAKEVTNE